MTGVNLTSVIVTEMKERLTMTGINLTSVNVMKELNSSD